MLAKLNVKCTQKDKENDREVIEWRDILINDEVIATCIEVPETKTTLIQLINGDKFLYKGSHADILKVFKR